MKSHLLLIISLLFLSFEALGFNIVGHVYRVGGKHYIYDQTARQYLPLQTSTPSAERTLSTLRNFDFIKATGNRVIRQNRDYVVLSSIDFVALKNLLGTWENAEISVRFLNYENVEIESWKNSKRSIQKYSYALSPGRGNAWKLFLTNQETVILGLLTLDSTSVGLELFNSTTGEVSESHQLQRNFPINP